MRRRSAANLPCVRAAWIGSMLLAALCTLAATPALAEEHACAKLAVDADARVRERWPDLPERVREEFDAREDIDGCAGVNLGLRDGAIAVQVALADGRSALRTVAREEDVLSVLDALLLVPGRDPGTHELAAPNAPAPTRPEPRVNSHAKATATGVVPPLADRAPAATSPGDPVGRVRIEFAIATGARHAVDAELASVDVGVLSMIDIDRWLLGFAGRVDRYLPEAGNPAATALEFAVLAGRRIWLHSLALDLTAGPALGSGTNTTVVAPASSAAVAPRPTANVVTVPRLLFGARLNFGARSVLRTFASLEGELGAVPRAGALPSAQTTRSPLFSVGLALGATVGTL